MNKSFVLSGGRKNDRFESGFKPATLPDWQNGNVNTSRFVRGPLTMPWLNPNKGTKSDMGP